MQSIEIQLYLDPLQSTLFIFCVLFEVALRFFFYKYLNFCQLQAKT